VRNFSLAEIRTLLALREPPSATLADVHRLSTLKLVEVKTRPRGSLSVGQ